MKNITIHTLFTLSLPLFLVGFELMLRHLFNVEISSFIGPSLGASGLGLLLECTKPKKVTSTNEIEKLMENIPIEYQVVLRDEKDENLVHISWAFIVVGSAIWVFTCSKSIQTPNNLTQNIYNSSIVWAIIAGTLIYITGVICLYSKEKNVIRKTC